MDNFDLYFFLEWIHIVNAAVLFGAGIGNAFHLMMSHRDGNTTAIAQAAKNTVKMDRLVTLPAAIIQPATGILMIVYVGFQWNSPWLLTSYVLYLLFGLSWMRVVKSQKRAYTLAQAAATKNRKLPEEYHQIITVWNRFGLAALIALFAIFYLMIMKPDFWG